MIVKVSKFYNKPINFITEKKLYRSLHSDFLLSVHVYHDIIPIGRDYYSKSINDFHSWANITNIWRIICIIGRKYNMHAPGGRSYYSHFEKKIPFTYLIYIYQWFGISNNLQHLDVFIKIMECCTSKSTVLFYMEHILLHKSVCYHIHRDQRQVRTYA